MFQDQIKEILQSGELSSNEFQVYYTQRLIGAQGDNLVFASNKYIAEYIQRDEKFIKRTLKTLEEKEYIFKHFIYDLKIGFEIPRVIYFDRDDEPQLDLVESLVRGSKRRKKLLGEHYGGLQIVKSY